jgi:ABC-2 type transport system ATP-binding protein
MTSRPTGPGTSAIISLEDVEVRRDAFRFGPASLKVEPGYVVAVVGPNGSGKSTLFHTLTNLVQPSTGKVRIFGQTYAENEMNIRRRIGFVPERTIGMEKLTGLSIGAFAARWFPGWEDERFRHLLTAMEIDPAQQCAALSKGVRRRLASAVALSTGGDLLLADEPMDAVDPFFSERMLEWYTEYMMEGDRAIVFSTHSFDDVRRIADYILLINNGQVLGMYEKDALAERWQVFWVDAPPIPRTCGVVTVVDGPVQRLLTQDAEATRASLRAQGRQVVRTSAPELGEVLSALLASHTPGPVPAMGEPVAR